MQSLIRTEAFYEKAGLPVPPNLKQEIDDGLKEWKDRLAFEKVQDEADKRQAEKDDATLTRLETELHADLDLPVPPGSK